MENDDLKDIFEIVLIALACPLVIPAIIENKEGENASIANQKEMV